jgi:predicted nucleic acid-binding Zn finger protein
LLLYFLAKNKQQLLLIHFLFFLIYLYQSILNVPRLSKIILKDSQSQFFMFVEEKQKYIDELGFCILTI